MDEFQRNSNKHRSWQQFFLYPLFFREDLYAIAHYHHLDRSGSSEPTEIVVSNFFSFLTVKRSIRRIRKQNNYSISLLGNSDSNQLIEYNKNFSFKSILEGFTIVLEVSFAMRSKHFIKGMDGWNSLRSIHCIFPFMEAKLPHSNYISDIRVPYSIHPEILVRIFRRWIRDVPSLHLLRSILHEWKNSFNRENLQKALITQRENTRFSLFLWNSYVYECESFLIPLIKRILNSQSLLYGSFPDRTHFEKKIKDIVLFPPHKISTKKIWLLKDSFIHYVRYGERSLIALKGTHLQVKKCRYHLFHFWQYYFHLWFQPYRICSLELSKTSFSFLGFFMHVKMRPLVVRAKMLDDLFITDLITNELNSTAPIRSILFSLAKEKFCDISGWPISKLSWTSLSDDDILDRFDRICINLFHYYSGSINQDGLYHIKYILLLSCAKTLACKHKSTIRVVREQLGSELFTKSFSKEREFISSSFSKTRSQRERIWNLEISQINPLANFWQKMQNKQIEN
uniref:Maturase K n=4 Tax=Chamaecyparis pisifera TaxID=99808 RepID=I2ANM6_9CONI|nr:maturase K [Chamaecyparis pisifera]AFJ38912.1 maturase K [Chamaecyparis pisifera]AFJ38913.1 maturase K [Chamaecyparis pisifera]AFJ38914.1 maturase K [Chamaecyparis pisifera]QRN72039.1 maturase K [Chamaecyparis pisifera]WBP65684.1 maturase K [Chamaecyparis pisifera]